MSLKDSRSRLIAKRRLRLYLHRRYLKLISNMLIFCCSLDYNRRYERVNELNSIAYCWHASRSYSFTHLPHFLFKKLFYRVCIVYNNGPLSYALFLLSIVSIVQKYAIVSIRIIQHTFSVCHLCKKQLTIFSDDDDWKKGSENIENPQKQKAYDDVWRQWSTSGLCVVCQHS